VLLGEGKSLSVPKTVLTQRLWVHGTSE